jgi:hypothetical protein
MDYLADTNGLLRSTHQVHPLTFNGPDFIRYPGIHVIHPKDLAKAANP